MPFERPYPRVGHRVRRALDEAGVVSRQVQKLDGTQVLACSVTGQNSWRPGMWEKEMLRAKPQLVWLLLSPGPFSTAQANCGCRGCGCSPVGECGFQLGGLKPQLTFRPSLVLHGQGIETQLIFPAALFPATLSERARRCQSSELPPRLPRGIAPRCKGGGQLSGTAR